jgi:hypothetical protein
MNTPWRCSMRKVSRELCPSASTTCRLVQGFAAGQHHAFELTIVDHQFATLLSKRTSPPSAMISSRIAATTPVRRKVPICGLLT